MAGDDLPAQGSASGRLPGAQRSRKAFQEAPGARQVPALLGNVHESLKPGVIRLDAGAQFGENHPLPFRLRPVVFLFPSGLLPMPS